MVEKLTGKSPNERSDRVSPSPVSPTSPSSPSLIKKQSNIETVHKQAIGTDKEAQNDKITLDDYISRALKN